MKKGSQSWFGLRAFLRQRERVTITSSGRLFTRSGATLFPRPRETTICVSPRL